MKKTSLALNNRLIMSISVTFGSCAWESCHNKCSQTHANGVQRKLPGCRIHRKIFQKVRGSYKYYGLINKRVSYLLKSPTISAEARLSILKEKRDALDQEIALRSRQSLSLKPDFYCKRHKHYIQNLEEERDQTIQEIHHVALSLSHANLSSLSSSGHHLTKRRVFYSNFIPEASSTSSAVKSVDNPYLKDHSINLVFSGGASADEPDAAPSVLTPHPNVKGSPVATLISRETIRSSSIDTEVDARPLTSSPDNPYLKEFSPMNFPAMIPSFSGPMIPPPSHSSHPSSPIPSLSSYPASPIPSLSSYPALNR